jgi:hypothetical protein
MTGEGLETLVLSDCKVDLIIPDCRNSVLPDCRVDLKTLSDDRVNPLISLRFF